MKHPVNVRELSRMCSTGMNPRYLDTSGLFLGGIEDVRSVPRIKSKKARGTRVRRRWKRKKKVGARGIHILWGNHRQPLSTVCSVLSFCLGLPPPYIPPRSFCTGRLTLANHFRKICAITNKRGRPPRDLFNSNASINFCCLFSHQSPPL